MKRGGLATVPAQPPPPVRDKPPDLDDLVDALRLIVRRGLPVTPATADDRLLALRGVWARSVDPDDRLYRVQGLDRLLREVLAAYPADDGLAEAALTLFGMALGSRGTTLTARWQRIAHEQSYTVEHKSHPRTSKLRSDFNMKRRCPVCGRSYTPFAPTYWRWSD
jgi:hypothetical protein